MIFKQLAMEAILLDTQMDVQMEDFSNLPTTAFTFHGMSLHSEAIVPIIREK